MKTPEWATMRHNSRLDVELLHAYYVQHAYPRHSHDYYVISLIQQGRQTFMHRGTRYSTPPGGIILINPGAVHTGEPADTGGFELRSLYPTISHMNMAMGELTGGVRSTPMFADVRVDDPRLSKSLLKLHKTLIQETPPMEVESRFLWVMTELVRRYATAPITEQKLGNERSTIQKARQYIDERFSQGVSLNALSEFVSLSPFYLLRAFRAEVGMPPYAYLESVRIRHTQKMIETGKPLAEIAAEVGFSSQSHMTRSFRQIIGITPGQYARHIREK